MPIAFTLLIGIYLLASPTTANIECDSAFECQENNIADNANGLVARGYGSAASAFVNVAGTIQCSGSHSCYEAPTLISKTSIECYGELACFGSANIASNAYVRCYGSNSCANANITTDNGIQCGGDYSCANANISIAETGEGRGAYSFSNSIITSAGDTELDMEGYYAGYSATFICQSGDECTINCFANACSMLYVQCDGDCTINLNSNVTVAPITDLAMLDLSDTVFLYGSLAILNDVNGFCDAVSNLAFDDYAEREDGADIDTASDAICCRGDSACEEIGNIVSSSRFGDPILCSGVESCYDNELVESANAILCTAQYSCEDQALSQANSGIYCLGEESCIDSGITVSGDIYCAAEEACDESTIESSGDINVYFLGLDSAYEAVVNCNEGDECNIVCGGYASCSDTIVNCDGLCTVQCDEDTGCPQIISSDPTPFPTMDPTQDTIEPTGVPTADPTGVPTADPTGVPTADPSKIPTGVPTADPTKIPTGVPTADPTKIPTFIPSNHPTNDPTSEPTTSAPSRSHESDSDSGSESGSESESESDESAMALFSAQRMDENVSENADDTMKEYQLTLDLNTTSWIHLWIICGALMLLNAICFIVCCRKKAI